MIPGATQTIGQMQNRSFTTISLLFLCALTVYAAETPAEVSGVFGPAFADSGSGEVPLRVGTKLSAGTTVRTGPRGAADIFLGSELGVIRLTQNTILRIEQIHGTNTYLHLQQGSILGNGSNVGERSRYEIKTAVGIAAVTRAAFRLHAEGYFVVLDGKAHFAHVPANGEPKLHNLSAPPAVYFSATEGIQQAPKELVREVVNQSKARLGQ
jgi:hypothetical protein